MSEITHRPIEWSTLEEYHGDPDVLRRMGGSEWNSKPEGYADKFENMPIAEWKLRRRTFMKMSGFAAVLAMVAGCEKPLEHIIPYNKAPEEITLGIPNYYASTCGGCSAGCGTHVKTREGRPLKLEGNPKHKINKGTLCGLGQASLISLYDPDRLRKPVSIKTGAESGAVKWDEQDAKIAEAFKTGKGVLLTGSLNGVATEQLLQDFIATFPNTKHVMYNPLADDNRAASREICFGDAALPQYKFDEAEVTVLLGSDPYVDGYSPLQDARNIAAQRRVKGEKAGEFTMGRLYAFEPMMTATGMSADYRFGVKPTSLLQIAQALISQLVADGHSEISGLSSANLATAEQAEKDANLPAGMIKKLADDLWAHHGRSLVYTGGTQSLTEDGLALHIAVNTLNAMLGNEGKTIDTTQASLQSRGSYAAIGELIEAMNAGNVDVILIHNTNPAYSLPADSGFAAALAKVSLKVSASQFIDETAQLCDVVLPGLHFLESWGDHEPIEGYLSLQQPTVQPLWDNRAFEQTLIEVVRKADAAKFVVAEGAEGEPKVERSLLWREYIQNAWKGIHANGGFASEFQEFWYASLRAGVLELPSRIPSRSQSFNSSALAKAVGTSSSKALELVLFATANIGDGTFTNIPHLLELPDPVTKISWDNYFTFAPSTAKAQDLADGDMIAVTANGKTVEGPVRIQPGLHPGVMGAGLGWGRTACGQVGDGEGFNAYALASFAKKAFSGAEVAFKKLGTKIRLADMQGHNYMRKNPNNENEPVRQLIQATSLEMLNEDAMAPQAYYHIPYWETTQRKPDYWFTREKHTINGEKPVQDPADPNRMEWQSGEHPMVKHKWVMTIDLNSCTGCNACVTACSIENNVPVVGKREVLIGREMHWIRLDRYYKGDIENPEIVKMPMMCQHCDNAPCETVCPVLATVHSDDGLNQQVYNRCVGTRYCANNCPFKVRRFSFYHYSKYRKGPHQQELEIPESPLALGLNPEITIRSKGIMEKCSFCTQRIRQTKYEAKKRGENIHEGELKTACQQTCPTQAISFGDAMNPEHEVNNIRIANHNKRGFGVLEEFNVQPNIMYLAHIHNRETRDYDVKYHKRHEHGHDDSHGDAHGDDHGTGHGDDHSKDAHGTDSHGTDAHTGDHSTTNEKHSSAPTTVLEKGVRS